MKAYALPGTSLKRIARCLARAVAGRGGTKEDARRSYEMPLLWERGDHEIAGPPNPITIVQMQPHTAERVATIRRAGEAEGTKEGARPPYVELSAPLAVQYLMLETEETEMIMRAGGGHETVAAAHPTAAVK